VIHSLAKIYMKVNIHTSNANKFPLTQLWPREGDDKYNCFILELSDKPDHMRARPLRIAEHPKHYSTDHQVEQFVRQPIPGGAGRGQCKPAHCLPVLRRKNYRQGIG
jgi:hypothetical protein